MTTDPLGTVKQTPGHMTAGHHDKAQPAALTAGPMAMPMVHTMVSCLACF